MCNFFLIHDLSVPFPPNLHVYPSFVKIELSFVSKVKNFENLKQAELLGECRQKMSSV